MLYVYIFLGFVLGKILFVDVLGCMIEFCIFYFGINEIFIVNFILSKFFFF